MKAFTHVTPRQAAGGAAVAVLALCAAACGGSGGSSSAGSAGSAGGGSARSGQVQNLTVAIPPVVSGADVYVAQSRGFFAQHHLDVTVKTMNGGAAILPAMQSGAVQIGETNVLSVIQAAARGLREPCIAGHNTDPASGHYLSLVGSAKAGGTTAKSLSGKTVAVNATSGVNQLLADAYLSAEGVSPGSVHFIGLPFPDMPAALASGRVAAAVTSEPFTTISLGQGQKLLTGTPLSYVPGRPTYSCWNATASWLSSHKTVAADFAAAMKQADAYITADPARFRSVAVKHLTMKSAVLDKITLPVFTTALSASDIMAWEKAAQKYHIVASSPPTGDVLAKVSS